MKALARLSVVILAATLLGPGCTSEEPLQTGRFRASEGRIWIDEGDGWRRFVPTGVELRGQLPGDDGGQWAASDSMFSGWLQEMASHHVNAVLAPTLLPARFYAALDKHNRTRPEARIWLLQGVPMPPDASLYDDATAKLDADVQDVIDALHGDADLAPSERRGSGRYSTDASPWVMGWLVGDGLRAQDVAAVEAKNPAPTSYDGLHLALKEGPAVAAFAARVLDRVIDLDLRRYGHQRLVGWLNQSRLDPLKHPTAPPSLGEDLVSADLAAATLKAGFEAGVFAAYRVSPSSDELVLHHAGGWQGYVSALATHHGDVPLLIVSDGLGACLGQKAVHPQGLHDGGLTELQHGAAVARTLQDALAGGADGVVAGPWIDRWGARSQNKVMGQVTAASSRWLDALDPAQHRGLHAVATEAARPRWNAEDLSWKQAKTVTAAPDGMLRGIDLAVDEAYLWLKVRLDPNVDLLGNTLLGLGDTGLSEGVLAIGLDTMGGERGQRRWPVGTQTANGDAVTVPADRALESVIMLDVGARQFTLLTAANVDPSPTLNGEATETPGALGDDGSYALARAKIMDDKPYQLAGSGFVPLRRYFVPGQLRQRTSAQDTLAHVRSEKGAVIVRIPWLALWITDPPSGLALTEDPAQDGWQSTASDGVVVSALWLKKDGGALRTVDTLPRQDAGKSVWTQHQPRYQWPTWQRPKVLGLRAKPALQRMSAVFAIAQEAL